MPIEHTVIVRLSFGPAAVEWHLGEMVDASCLADIIDRRVSMTLDRDDVPLLYIGDRFIRNFSTSFERGFFDRLLFWVDNEDKYDDVYDFDASSPERHPLFNAYLKQVGINAFTFSGCTLKTEGLTLVQWPAARTDGASSGYALDICDPSKITDIETAALRGLVMRATTAPTQCVLSLEHGPATVEWHLRDMTDAHDIEKIVSHDVSMRVTDRKELELLVGDKVMKVYDNRIFNEKNDQIAFWLEGEDKSEFQDYVFASAPYRYPLFRDHLTRFGTDGFKLAACEITSNSKTLDHWLSA